MADSEVFPSSFHVYRKDRTKRGGGVFILVSVAIVSCELQVNRNTTESVWCRVTQSDSSSFVVGAFYRPPASEPGVINELRKIACGFSADCVLLGGDFNLPDVAWCNGICVLNSGAGIYTELKNLCDTLGYVQYVSEPTRDGNILDLMFCNAPDVLSDVRVIPGISDHHVVTAKLIIAKKQKQKIRESRKVYFFDKADYTAISESLNSHFLSFECIADDVSINDLWNLFKDRINSLTAAHVPSISSSKLEKRLKPWMNGHLIKLIRKRRRAYSQYCRTKSPHIFQKLKSLTALFKSKMKENRKKYFERLVFDFRRNNRKGFYKFMKRCSSSSDKITPHLVHDNLIITGDSEKANIFNNFFKSVFRPPITTPAQPRRNDYPPMPPLVLTHDGILELLYNIDESKAIGPDGISPRVLKHCSQAVSPYLYVLYNKSLTQGTLPDEWKEANIVPVFKSGKKSDASNYRPISLTPICCKTLEHIIYSALMQHLTSIEFLNPRQHGFRRGYSCTTQLIEFYHDIAAVIDDRGQIDCLFLDFQKAFDTVSHPVLMNKLENLNLDETITAWIADYLTLRKQKVVLNGVCSSLVSVTSGVPQGSVLGPLLFLIFINDISNGITSQMRLYADDCVLYSVVTNETGSTQLQDDICRIEQWCRENSLFLNTKKCVHVSFTKKRKKLFNSYILDNQIIKKEASYKYLGVTFSEDGTWAPHIQNMVNNAGRALSWLQRNLKAVSADVKQAAYQAYVRPILEYACPVWDPFHRVHVDAIERIQSVAARFVTGKFDRFLSTTTMKRELCWYALSERRKNLRLKLFFSIFHNQTGISAPDYLQQPHYVSSRNDHKLKVRSFYCRTDLFKHSFFPRTINDWNLLPDDVVCRKTADMFYDVLCPPL